MKVPKQMIDDIKKAGSKEEFIKRKMVDKNGDTFVYKDKAPDDAFIFAEDGYTIQKGDFVKEYMKGGKFVPADSLNKVGKITNKNSEYLTIKKIKKSELSKIYDSVKATD